MATKTNKVLLKPIKNEEPKSSPKLSKAKAAEPSKPKKPEVLKVIDISEHDDNEEETEDDGEGDEGDESDESLDEESQVVKDKKKETFTELIGRLETIRLSMKSTQKEVTDLKQQVKLKEKEYSDHERQCNSVLKLLTKSHTDEVNKVRKEKPKRKGNVNGGFNKEVPVPDVLISFLGLAPGVCMSRPKVMSALNNKFTQLGLKKGQSTTLDKATSKALKLSKDDECREIKFTEFQSFLASFYPKKVADVTL